MEYYEYSSSSPPQRERVTHAVQRLILYNILIFCVQLAFDVLLGAPPSLSPVPPPPGGLFTSLLSCQPSLLMSGAIWTPFTYQFLHGGLMHLFLNMLWLYFFGPEVERALGTRQFFRFYLCCGAAAVLFTLPRWLFSGYDVSVSGASGAIMACVVAFAMINPERQFILFPLPIPITARGMVWLVVALNIFSGLGNGNTSVATHFGGLAAGYLYMKYIPAYRLRANSRRANPNNSADPVGEMVDNIFKFEKRKRWR